MLVKKWLTGLIVVSFTLLSACSTAPIHKGLLASSEPINNIHKSPNDKRQYRSVYLVNGLQVLLVSDPSIEVSGASLSVGTGSYANPKAIPGLAHYLEHMLFLGTKKYPKPNSFQKFVQENAGFTNAYTATDHTNFFFQIDRSAFAKALDRYSDYFKSPSFNRESSDKERSAVDSEWSTGRTQDARIINRLRGLTANPQHPAQQMAVGNLKTLVDQPGHPLYKSMLKFYHQHYSANNMKLVLFGSKSLDKLQALAVKYFAGIKNNHSSRDLPKQRGLTADVQGENIYYKPQKPMRQLIIEFPIVNNTQQWPVKPNQYIANLISSEEPGTAAQVLRHKGWIDDFTTAAQPNFYGPDGIFAINIGVTKKGLKHQDDIIATVFAYLHLIKQQGVSKDYYREYKAMLAKQFADMQVPNPLHQAISYSRKLFDIPADHIIDSGYSYDHFDPAVIKKVLQELQPKRARIWHINPEVKVNTSIPYYAGQYRVAPFAAKQLEHWHKLAEKTKLQLPKENDLFSSAKAKIVPATITSPQEVVDKPGIEAWLMHSQYHQSENGYLQVMFNSDLPQQSAKNNVMSDLINRIFAQQTTPLRDKAGRAGIGMGIVRPQDNHALTLSGYSEKHPLLYRRLLKRWVNMSINQQQFAIAMDGFKDWVQGHKKAEPNRQLFTQLDRLLKTASWTDEQLLAAAKTITLKQLLAYQKKIVHDNRVRIFAFGNYTKGTVKKIAAITSTLLGDKWQKRERYFEHYHTPSATADAIAYQSDVNQHDNALLQAYYSTDPSLDVAARLLLLNSMFYQAFYTQLRTEEQIGYVVGSSIDRIGDYWGLVLFAQSTNTELGPLQARFDRFIKEYRPQLAALKPEMLAQLRNSVIAQVNQPPSNFYDEYPRYLNDFYRGNDKFDTRKRLTQAIKSVKKADLLALYDSLLLQHQGQKVTVQLRGNAFKDTNFAPQLPKTGDKAAHNGVAVKP